jgi:hypothetical protein
MSVRVAVRAAHLLILSLLKALDHETHRAVCGYVCSARAGAQSTD